MAQASWGAKKGVRHGSPRVLWLARGLWTLGVVLLLGWLGWLLWRPFRHPRTHLVLLSGDVVAFDPAPYAPPADFVVEDFRALLGLENVLHRGLLEQPGPLILGSLRTPDEMQKLADRLNERVTGRGDVLIVYAVAHGLTQDNDAWLLASGADSQSPFGGRYRLASLLAQLRECEAATKLLVLDAGRIEYDPLRGLLDNDFPEQLVERVEELGDPTIFVLCSHAAGQRSHLSPALRRSVFGYFVASGLKGAADSNGNRAVDLAELSRFVTAGVSGWVKQTSGEAAEQTPLLAWGGGSPLPSSLPVLVAVPRETKKANEVEVDHAKVIETAREEAEVDPRLVSQGQSELNSLIARGISQGTPQGRFGHFIGDAARQASSKAVAAAPKLPGKAEGKEPKAEEAQEKKDDLKVAVAKSGEPVNAEEQLKSEAKNGAKVAARSTSAPAGPSREELSPQLDRAWKLRDELAASDRPAVRPVDYAPHLWRQVEQRLLTVDRRLRTGFLLDTRRIAAELQEVNATLDTLSTTTTSNHVSATSLTQQFAALVPGRPLAGVEPSSLAVAELLAREGARPLGEELPPLIARLDRLIAAGNRTDLEAFAAELKPEHDRWLELRIVRRLAGRPDLDWRLVQLVLDAARLAEQTAAASTNGSQWVRPEVDAADAQRLSAERQLLAGATYDRDTAIANLTQAVATYKAALDELAAIRSGERLANDVWFRLPDYLAWNAAAGNVRGVGPTRDELADLLPRLTALGDLLAAPGAGRAAEVRQAAGQLQTALEQVRAAAEPRAAEQLLSPPISAGKAWKIALLLETSLPTAEMRAALAAGWPEVDAALAAQVQVSTGETQGELPANALRVDDNRYEARARLQLQAWTAAFRNIPGADFNALQASLTPPLAAGANARSASLDARRESFSARLHDLLRDLPADIARGTLPDLDLSSPANRTARLARLGQWNRVLRLIDPRTPSESAASISSALNDAATYDLLTWLYARAQGAAEDAPPQEAAQLQNVAVSYRTAAAAISHQPPLSGEPDSPLQLAGTDRVTLTYLALRQADFTIRNTSASPLKVWLTVEADEKLLEISSAAGRTLYAWSELTTGDVSGGTVGTRVARLPPTLELLPGQTAKAPLRLIRRQASLHPAHLIIRAVTEQHIARHDVTVELPPPEDIQLTIASPVNRWTPQRAGVELLPFPNRVNAFAFELASGKSEDRKVDVEVFPLIALPPQGLPAEPLSVADAGRLRREMSILPIVAEARGLALPGGGELVAVPLEKPKVPEPMPPAAGQKTNGKASGADAGSKAPQPASDKPPPVPLASGLVAIITDLADQRQTFRHLAIAPQRPQRYIRPQVRYRAARERIEIVVAAQDPLLLPADGVRIRAEIVEPIPADAERQLETVLKSPATEAELFAEVPAGPGKFVTLRLTVDDYPRAMYFRVPCSGETSDVPEDLDVLAVRITDLPQGTIYKPPTAMIPVQLAIDAPAAALKSPPLKVEIGIDRNRDRELRGDETLLVTTDRQVTASLIGISKAGDLQIEALVTDITVDVPAGSLVSGRANMLAHAMLGDKEAWSAPLEIVSDGQPPRASAIELRPTGVAVIGSDVLVSALADDLGLSGVAKLEVAFDLDRSGKFGPATKPVAGALGDDGRWAAKLPTAGLASGAFNVLVRAIDRAGNASEPARASIRLLTAEEAAADALKSNAADISGVVTYGGQPQAGVTVSLLAEGTPPPPPKTKAKAPAPPPLVQATTDAQGRFMLAKIAPGKYVVVAAGLVRNKNRRAEQSVTFAKPADVQPLTLEFK